MRVFGMPVVPPVSKTKTGLPASPCGTQRCTGPPRSHSSSNEPRRLRSLKPLISRARIPAELRRVVEPERTAGRRIEMPGDDLAHLGVERRAGGGHLGLARARRNGSRHRAVSIPTAPDALSRHVRRTCAPPLHHRGSALRAASGRLVLARGASARVRRSCRSASSTTRPTRWRLAPAMWAARAADLAVAPRAERPRMIPALVVFAYLGVVLYIGIFAFRSRRGGAERRGLLPRRPLARPGGLPAVARSAPT